MWHEVKVTPIDFREVFVGNKQFEIVEANTCYTVGDTLVVQEYDGAKLTGQELVRKVSYVLQHGSNKGLQSGYCIVGWQQGETLCQLASF